MGPRWQPPEPQPGSIRNKQHRHLQRLATCQTTQFSYTQLNARFSLPCKYINRYIIFTFFLKAIKHSRSSKLICQVISAAPFSISLNVTHPTSASYSFLKKKIYIYILKGVDIIRYMVYTASLPFPKK